LPLEEYYKPDFVVRIAQNAAPLPPEVQKKMDGAGIKSATDNFGYVFPKRGRLIYEQPLSRAIDGYSYDRIIDAVYQSFSNDGGKTWSEPIVSSKAEIFEIGKSRLQQSFRARPLSLNGVKVN
jgi:hypothetical protein